MNSWFEKSYVYRKKIHPVLAKVPLYDYVMLRRHSWLAEKGWFKSFRQGRSIDNQDTSIPWFVYGAIEFVKERLPEDAMVFEYGSGGGTAWWARHAECVDSVEHNKSWQEATAPGLPENANLMHRKLNEGYESAILATGKSYDLVVLDGRNRDKCLGHALRALSQRGVILFDDSDWEKYQKTIQYIQSLGYRQLPFRGFCPIDFLKSETSLFYRDENIFDI